eukprot:3634104-Pyramimonas_sp.AAC.1
MGITSCLPTWDVEADHAADIDPDHLCVAEADQTRLITNLSPHYTASTGARFLHTTKWREEWLRPGAAGARAGYHYQTVAYELALAIEHSRLTGTS